LEAAVASAISPVNKSTGDKSRTEAKESITQALVTVEVEDSWRSWPASRPDSTKPPKHREKVPSERVAVKVKGVEVA